MTTMRSLSLDSHNMQENNQFILQDHCVSALGLLKEEPVGFTYPLTFAFQRQLSTIEEDKAHVCDVLVDKEENEADSSQC